MSPSGEIKNIKPGRYNHKVFRATLITELQRIKKDKDYKEFRLTVLKGEEITAHKALKAIQADKTESTATKKNAEAHFWKVIVQADAEANAFNEAIKPEHNTYINNLGRYAEPTNNIQTLTLPATSDMFIVLERGSEGSGVDLSGPKEVVLGVHAQDVHDIMGEVNSNEGVRGVVQEMVDEGRAAEENWNSSNPGKRLDIDTVSKDLALKILLSRQHASNPEVHLVDRLHEVRDGDAIMAVYLKSFERGFFDDMNNYSLYLFAEGGRARLK